jgi:RHS repeat-associated protein
MTSKGTFDAENRLILTSQSASYLYDGNGRRFRTNDGNVIYYIYSFAGQLLTEDRITESTSNNYIYFNGQLVAIHQQNDNYRLLLKDHLGSTRKVLTVLLPNGPYAWSCTESYDYEPFGGSSSSASPTRQMFQAKERNGDLDYYGARYYDSRQFTAGSSMRWISADSVTPRVYDPPSLNKYTFVRNDPVNKVDPNGREWISWTIYYHVDYWFPGAYAPEMTEYGSVDVWQWISSPPPPRSDDDPVIDMPGGGSPEPSIFRVRNPSKTGSNQDRIVAVLNKIKSDIDPDCAKWLGDVSGTINSLLGDSSNPETVFVAHGVFDRANVAAFTGTAGTDLPAGYAALVVNDNGGFFKSNDLGVSITVAGYGGGSPQAQALIMLHELAHILNASGFKQNDFGNDNAITANNDMVKSRCAKTINAFK